MTSPSTSASPRTASRATVATPNEGRPPRRNAVAIVKRSVSLDADLDQELTKRFGRGGKSRFLNSAAWDALARLRLTDLLLRYDEEDGPVPDEVHTVVAQMPRPR